MDVRTRLQSETCFHLTEVGVRFLSHGDCHIMELGYHFESEADVHLRDVSARFGRAYGCRALLYVSGGFNSNVNFRRLLRMPRAAQDDAVSGAGAGAPEP